MAKSSAQLNREIAAALAAGPKGKRKRRSLSHLDKIDSKTPLYGHTSEATAYVVDNYPYGFREKTQIRYWLEKNGKKGWRFVSQTLNPKTNRWNKPKASTYTEFGAAMFLDDNGHVKWDAVGQYSDEQKVLSFIRTFPGADMSVLRQFVPQKLEYIKKMISGKIAWTINGVRQPVTEADTERLRKELEDWEEINVYLDQAA